MSLPGSTVCEPARNQPRHIACVHPQNLKATVRAAQCGSTTLGSRPAPRKHPRHDLKRPWQRPWRHDLRHTHERRRAGAGLGLPIIGKLLGHAQASTTARARCRHGQHLRGWTYYFASRRRLSNPLVCSRVSFRPIDSLGINGVNSGSIWQPPTNKDALMRPFTATRSRAWLRIC